MTRRKGTLIFTATLSGLLGLACRQVSPRRGASVIRLAQATCQATRLDADRALLAPRNVVAHPADLEWSVESGDIHVMGDATVRIDSAGPCAISAQLELTEHVEYRVEAIAVGPQPALQVGMDPSAEHGTWGTAVTTTRGDRTEMLFRTPPATAHARLRISAAGAFSVESLTIVEADRTHGTHGLASAEDLLLRADASYALGKDGRDSRFALVGPPGSVYEWPLEPSTVARVLDVETGTVPGHGANGAIALTVELREGQAWKPAFTETRAFPDEEGWKLHTVPLAGADAVRLRVPGAEASHGGVLAAWGAPIVRPLERGPQPDVVLISIDALRADQLGAYGSKLGLSPNIDRMASQSVLFEEARASRAETWVSLSAISWASRPEHIGVGTRGLLPQRGLRSVAGVFADAGYLTARIGQFDVPPGQLGPFDIEENASPDPVIEERVAHLLETRRSQPLFLWVHFAVTHYPYNPSPDFLPPGVSAETTTRASFAEFGGGRSAPPMEIERMRTLYQAGIRQTDAAVGKLLRALEAPTRGAGPAIVAVTADHGTEMGEHGPWFLHSTVWREALRVPLIVYAPGRVTRARVASLVRLIDVGPTLLDYADLDAGGFEASSLRPLAQGEPAVGRVSVLQVPDLGIVVVEDDRYKMISHPSGSPIRWPEAPGAEGPLPRLGLFEWRADPTEQHNIVEKKPLVWAEMLRQANSGKQIGSSGVSSEARRLLEQAGYTVRGPEVTAPGTDTKR